MKKLKRVALVLTAVSPMVLAQTANLILPSHPKEVKALMTKEGKLKLNEARRLCNFLTDKEITEIDGYPFPKKRKSTRRHVKHLCEDIELQSWKDEVLTNKEINHLYELSLLRQTYAAKAEEEVKGLTFKQRMSMGWTSFWSPTGFSYKKKLTDNEARNLKLTKPLKDYSVEEFSLLEPENSPYYTNLDGQNRYKRYKELSKAKKIKFKKGKVLIFKSVSDSGSAPKIKTEDTNLDDEWSLKWGDEIHTDSVGSRLFAALGFDVDHPFYVDKNDVTLVFPQKEGKVKDHKEMIKTVKKNFKIDIDKYVSESGIVSEQDAIDNKKLKDFIGLPYVRFVECAVEGRPDRVKRLGPMMADSMKNKDRRELRGSLLAHLWIDNWDTRAENTMMAINHLGKHRYKSTGVFSDLGTSLGVAVKYVPVDFRVGLVNEFSWDMVKKLKNNKVQFKGQLNAKLAPYKKATYADLRWMASKIAQIDGETLEKILEKSGFPKGLAKLYFHKLASRRAQILEAFDIKDMNPINYDRRFSYEKNGKQYIKNGKLIKDFSKKKHPIGYLNKKGRLRNYGQGK